MMYVYCPTKSDSQDSIIKCEMEVATVFSDMKIYYTSPLSVDMYDGEKIKTMTAFLDLSEAFSVDEQNPLIDPSDFDKNSFRPIVPLAGYKASVYSISNNSEWALIRYERSIRNKSVYPHIFFRIAVDRKSVV